jgi:hypothetical protein
VTLRGWFRSYDGNPPWNLAAAIAERFQVEVEIDGNDISNDFYQRAKFYHEDDGTATFDFLDAVDGGNVEEKEPEVVYVQDGKRLAWWGKWPTPLDDQETDPNQ